MLWHLISMGKLSLERMLDCFFLSNFSSSCLCTNKVEDEEIERVAFIEGNQDKDSSVECKTLAFHLEPKTVVLRVSMHCNGCARKVQKHISKMDGVTSFEVDLESKRVIVMGDITPFEVLENLSKIKLTQFWISP